MIDYPMFSLRGVTETLFVNSPEIISVLANGNYTTIHLTNNRSIRIFRKLKQVEALLSNENFLRIHRSHLINLKHIRKYDQRESIEMSNGQKLPISRTCKVRFSKKFIRL